ncbi:MAG: twin-arginine translocation signal domain-containing protein [Planctomycetota bacterium]
MNEPDSIEPTRRNFLGAVAVGAVSAALPVSVDPRAQKESTTPAPAPASVRSAPRYHAAAIQTAFENPRTRAEIPS